MHTTTALLHHIAALYNKAKLDVSARSVGKCHMIHTHMAGGNSGVCNFSLDSVVRGYHICKSVWNPAVGDILAYKRESENDNDWLL